MKKYGWTRVATLLAASFASIAAVACSGGGGGSLGMGDGGVRTAESSCDVVIKWLNSCKVTIDRAACVKEASAYSANQLAASEECVNRSDCDKKGFQQCMDRVVASEPATATSAKDSTATTGDAGARGPTSPPAETDPAPTPTGSSSACTSCMTAKCAKQAQACQASAACKSLASCVAQAADAPQRAQCETDFGGGVGLYDGLMQCAQNSCSAECTY